MEDLLIKFEDFIRRLMVGRKESKFDNLNKELIKRERSRDRLNEELIVSLKCLEKSLNKFFGTRGSNVVLDLTTGKKRRAPPIYIQPSMKSLDTFGQNKTIELYIWFKFRTVKHAELITVFYDEKRINFRLGSNETSDIQVFCPIVHGTVESSLGHHEKYS
ncbi:hypothetical protein [Vibrio pectenicida]|uniref:Uncharacterized protein n=1 Tax=Vibrio pectenicida TaxID=62763 RepID=A0A427U1C1_9VIBR|nr:hypothetical protein [Vibrio pectenicida]RSD30456.1 hypothetical protein EJA03_13745 [Vibrio pectenicida]